VLQIFSIGNRKIEDTMQNPKDAYKIGSEIEDGERIGRDPRKMTQDQFQSIGHLQKPLLDVIRAKCLDCCCENQAEVRRCMAVPCALWPYRLGTNPIRDKREYTDQEKIALANRLKLAREKSKG
jgi:hypothetical protein